MSTASSRSAFDESFPEEDLILPDDLREELASPSYGDLVAEEELEERLKSSSRVICVGDVVTVTLIDMGLEPDVAVFDYRTRRSDDPDARARISGMKGTLERVENPAGMITRALWRAVRDAVASADKRKIEVAGEEDLAALVAVATAPDGADVIYGLPQRGLMVVRVEESTRTAAIAAISRMAR